MTKEQQKVCHLLAPCKINLILQVVGKREDGYHELVTWMQKLDLCDEINLKVLDSPGIALHCSESGIPTDHTNLAWKGADAFFKASSKAKGYGVEIELIKRIPSGAGLGGGSSDCGTVMKGLNQLFGNEFSREALIELATPLGADVPLFVVDDSAVLATGIGEVMAPVPAVDDCTFILLNPGFTVSTKWVFENISLTKKGQQSMMSRFRNADADSMSLDDMCNDLESVTGARFSEIEQMKNTLLDAGASKVMMSGSGPTVFGVFPDKKSDQVVIENVAKALRLEYKERVFVTRSCAGAWPSGQGTGF